MASGAGQIGSVVYSVAHCQAATARRFTGPCVPYVSVSACVNCFQMAPHPLRAARCCRQNGSIHRSARLARHTLLSYEFSSSSGLSARSSETAAAVLLFIRNDSVSFVFSDPFLFIRCVHPRIPLQTHFVRMEMPF